ncbi:MAG: glutathione S-transferase family protein [Micropepsaceae bacterium]
MPKLYQDPRSGNCYKAVLTASHLGAPLETINVDVMSGKTRQPEFLKKNPNGRVPTLELDDGTCLPESNAIIWYLAEGSPLIPDSRLARAQMLQWMFFEQYSHEPYIAVARFWLAFVSEDKRRERIHLLPEWHAKGYAALGVMETQLANNNWFAANSFTLADIALYAYTHCAADGGFDMGNYPRIRSWLKRVEGVKGYVAMPTPQFSVKSQL